MVVTLELQGLLHCSDKCRKAMKDVPMVAFRRRRDYLVHAKLIPALSEETPTGTFKS